MPYPIVTAVEFSQGVEDAWSEVASFVPKLLGFLVVLVVGYIVAKVIAKIADRVLERVGFDKAVERGGVAKAMERTKYDASDIVGKVIFYALFLIVLQMAFGVFGSNPVSDLITGVIAYLPKVLAAILIIVVAAAVAAAVKELLEASLGGLSYGRGLAFGAATAILVVGVFAALDQLQIAPDIVNGLFYAVLAIVAGSAIIAIGGGGILPMRARWDKALARLDEESGAVRQEAQGSKERIAGRAQERAAQAKEGTTQAKEGTTQAKEGTTQAKEGTTQAKEGTTQAKEGTTQAKEGTTQAKEGTTQAKEGTTQAKEAGPNDGTGSERARR